MKLFVLLLLLAGLTGYQESGSGIEICMIKPSLMDSLSKTFSNVPFIPTKDDLTDSIIVADKDIVKFDWENQQIILTKEVKEKIKIPPGPGMMTALVLNGEPIYVLRMMSYTTSMAGYGIYTLPELDFTIYNSFTNHNPDKPDPRFDPRLKEYVLKYKQ